MSQFRKRERSKLETKSAGKHWKSQQERQESSDSNERKPRKDAGTRTNTIQEARSDRGKTAGHKKCQESRP